VWPPSGLSLPRTSVSALTFLDCRAYTATPAVFVLASFACRACKYRCLLTFLHLLPFSNRIIVSKKFTKVFRMCNFSNVLTSLKVG
jgi:hypothetical protein